MLVRPPVLVVIAGRIDFAFEDRKRREFVLLRCRRECYVGWNLDLADDL